MRPSLAATIVLAFVSAAAAQEPPKPAASAPQPPSAAGVTLERKVPTGQEVLAQLKSEAGKLRPLVSSDLARAFLDTVSALPEPTARVAWRDKARTLAYTPDEAAKLSEEERGKLTSRTYDPSFFYRTGYGSPLVYARTLDLIGPREGGGGMTSLAGKKIMDFGCGTIAHLRMMAAMGADVHGVEVEPVFRVLYQSADQGEVPGIGGAPAGKVTMHIGRWPAETDIVKAVGSGYDLITSKNTLKRGYIHPARTTDPKFLVNLGVDDDSFLRQVHDALKPGGVFLIYNLSPAQNTVESGKPYLPHADGECPFKPEQLASAKLEVLEFDKIDRDKAVEIWMALGIGGEKPAEEIRKDLFAWYTLCRRSIADK